MRFRHTRSPFAIPMVAWMVAIFAGGQYVVGSPAGELTIQKTLGDALGVDYYAEYLDLGRFTTSDSALAFLVRSRDASFPGVPTCASSARCSRATTRFKACQAG